MAKILFVDDRPREIIRQWQLSGCGQLHQLLPLEPFESIEQVCQMVKSLQPDVVLIGYGLSKFPITGVDVIRALKNQGYTGYIIANSGGGTELFVRACVEVDASVNRNSHELRRAMETIFSK